MHSHYFRILPFPVSRMSNKIEVESTLTDRYQTTIPDMVRRALRLEKRDKIRYTIGSEGDVVLTKVLASPIEDPVLGQFLGFLARDITSHPERLKAVDAGLAARIQQLVGGIRSNLDAALTADED